MMNSVVGWEGPNVIKYYWNCFVSVLSRWFLNSFELDKIEHVQDVHERGMPETRRIAYNAPFVLTFHDMDKRFGEKKDK